MRGMIKQLIYISLIFFLSLITFYIFYIKFHNFLRLNCVKRVRIRSISGPYFPHLY